MNYCGGTFESAPEGWDDTVERMKAHPEISNPFALAHWMKARGYEPGEADLPTAQKNHAAECRRVEALRMIAARLDDPAALPDVAFGLRRVLESAPPAYGRRGILEDLAGKADRVEAEGHDPSTVLDLLQAVRAFLAEELRELEGVEDAPPSEEPVPPQEEEEMEEVPISDASPSEDAVPTAAAPADEAHASEIECPACGHRLAVTAAPESETEPEPERVPDENEDEEEEETPMQESRREAPAPEVAAPAATAVAPPAQEGDRLPALERENAELKARESVRKLKARAKKAIRESGIYMPPEELMELPEKTWPAVLRIAAGNVRDLGTAEPGFMPARESTRGEQATPPSYGDLFDQCFERVG